MNIAQFPKTRSLPPIPEPGQLTPEERNVWDWLMQGTSFDTMVIDLTPRLARLLLSRVAENRKLRPATVHRYQRQMERKQWLLTHQGIAISTRYEMIDGQHRCVAVVESGATIEILAVRGVSQDAMIVLDSGAIRTDTEAIQFSDVGLRDLDPTESNTAKRMMRGRRGVSREDVRAFIHRHREAIRAVCNVLLRKSDGSKNKIINVTTYDVVAVLARAMYHAPHEQVLAGARFLASGEQESNEQLQPLLVLREWLLGATKKQLRQRYGKTAKAVHAYLNGRQIPNRQKLLEAQDELFPLPEELVA